ncbi:MAG TPA: heliorhodopsin HeR [Phycicoccus sp.]|nr:heliorhodopsin HeR [Phycicoccus sp.]
MSVLPLELTTRSVEVPDRTARSLRTFNVVMGVLHALSGAAMVVLGNDFSLPVSTFALMGPPGTPLSEGMVNPVVDVPLAWAVASFLFLSAFFHLLIASPWGFPRYLGELERGRNRFRWVEYALSSTLMIVLIALITGVTDLAALVALGFANAAMILFGWLMEMTNNGLMHGGGARPARGARAWWTPFWFGCVAGIGPWVAIGAYLAVNISAADGAGPPGFVWGILVSLFVLFNTFAVNQWLQYRQVGRWRDYLFGERQYVILSLVAKSVLAWQVFANTLIPS